MQSNTVARKKYNFSFGKPAQVGSWSAMTGYSLAFPRHSKHKALFDKKILEMKENGGKLKKYGNHSTDQKIPGDLERLGRFWMNGVCKPNEQEKRASEPL